MTGQSRLRCKLSSVALGRRLLGKDQDERLFLPWTRILSPLPKQRQKQRQKQKQEWDWLGFPRTCPFASPTHNGQGRGRGKGTYCLWFRPCLHTAPPSPQHHHCGCQALACALTAGTGTRGPLLYFFRRVVLGLGQVPGWRGGLLLGTQRPHTHTHTYIHT